MRTHAHARTSSTSPRSPEPQPPPPTTATNLEPWILDPQAAALTDSTLATMIPLTSATLDCIEAIFLISPLWAWQYSSSCFSTGLGGGHQHCMRGHRLVVPGNSGNKIIAENT